MKNLRALAEPLKIYPKLRLGMQKIVAGEFDKNNNPKTIIVPTGPHRVKFLEEPVTTMGKDDKGLPRKELKFIVEEDGVKYRWQIPLLNKEGQPSYLIERLMNVEVGDERILEMMKAGIKNYVDVRAADEAPEPPEEELHAEDV